MILYADDIVLLCNNIDELMEIVNIYDKTFIWFGLKISTDKNETMAFNVDEEIKPMSTLISIGDDVLKNIRSFKYLGHMINKTQYDWFPGKSQNSKKFSAKFKQNPTSKNHSVFLNILGG